MAMLLDLIIKDAKRTRHNPWPILIFLAIPICITGLIGLTFGPKTSSGGLGRIKVAVVDEDNNVLGRMLRSGFSQGQAAEHFEPQVTDRATAERLINDNEISAVFVVPEGFTEGFFNAEGPPPLKLIKNPARTFHPAIVEELLGVLAEALSGVSAVFQTELTPWRELIQGEDRFDLRRAGRLLEQAGERLQGIEQFVYPPLISYTKLQTSQVEPGQKQQPSASSSSNPRVGIFTYILPGMAALFLLMMGDGATRDLYKELRFRTLDRYRTLRLSLFPLVIAKMVHSVSVMLAGALILFGGGGLLFGITWHNPLWLALLILSFCVCACGLLALLAALAQVERRADVINSLLVFGMAFIGGSMVPVNSLPEVVRRFASPLVPNYWFVEAARHLQQEGVDTLVLFTIPALAVAGLILAAVAAWRFTTTLEKGIRP